MASTKFDCTDGLSLIDQQVYVYATSGDFLTTVDPSGTATPVQDALDRAANNGGGVVLPANTTLAETGPVQLHDNVDIVSNRFEIEIQGAGNDGLYVNNAEALTANYLQANIWGELTVSHANGDNGATGIGCHLVSGVSNSHWGFVHFNGWNGRALYEELGAASFQWSIDHLHLTNVDAGDVNGVMDWQGGRAPIDIRYISAYPLDTGSLSDSHIFRCDSKAARIGVMNVGGIPDQAVRANSPATDGVRVGHINFEPSAQNGTPNAVVFSNGINPTRVDSVRISSGATVSYVFAQYSGGNNYWGSVRNKGTINSGHLDNRNDTTQTVIFEGHSADVVDNSAVTLTVPIACLGDLTTVS